MSVCITMKLFGQGNNVLEMNSIKILEIYFSYDKILKNDKNYRKHITKTVKGVDNETTIYKWKITSFDNLTISKIAHLAVVKEDISTKLNHNWLKYKLNLSGKTETLI